MNSTTFAPSRHGFPFRNDFEYPASRIGWGAPLAPSFGLAGGMCWAALDRYLAGRPVPPASEPPAPGDPLYEELVHRQVDLVGAGLWKQLYDWQSRPGRGGLLGPRGVSDMTRREWRELRRTLDRGSPVLVCVVRTRGPFANPSENALVLAYDYEVERETGKATVSVYDPNRPGRDDIRITVGQARRRSDLEVSYGAERARGFLLMPYDRAAPEDFRTAEPLALDTLPALAGAPVPLGEGRSGVTLLVGSSDGRPIHLERRNDGRWRAEDLSADVRKATNLRMRGSGEALPGRSRAVVVRNGEGRLILVARSRTGGWTVRPLIRDAGSDHALEAEPAAIAEGRNRLHVFGVSGGHLVGFSRDRLGRWSASDVSETAVSTARHEVVGRPAPILGADGRLNVLVRTKSGRVARYRHDGEDAWNAQVLPTVEERTLARDPVAAIAPGDDAIAVFGVTRDGSLLLVRESGTDSWRARDLTAESGRGLRFATQVTVAPAAGRTLHVFGTSEAGSLVHYWAPPTFAFRAEDLTDERPAIGEEARVAGRPWVETDAAGALKVFARGSAGGLVLYRWQPVADWTGETVPGADGKRAALRTDPVAAVDRRGRLHLFAIDDDGRMIHSASAAAMPGGLGVDEPVIAGSTPTATRDRSAAVDSTPVEDDRAASAAAAEDAARIDNAPVDAEGTPGLDAATATAAGAGSVVNEATDEDALHGAGTEDSALDPAADNDDAAAGAAGGPQPSPVGDFASTADPNDIEASEVEGGELSFDDARGLDVDQWGPPPGDDADTREGARDEAAAIEGAADHASDGADVDLIDLDDVDLGVGSPGREPGPREAPDSAPEPASPGVKESVPLEFSSLDEMTLVDESDAAAEADEDESDEAERLKAEEEARLEAEEEERRKAEEEARLEAEEEERRKAEEEEKRAKQEARRKKAEARRKAKEEKKRRKAEAKKKAEEEEARKKAEAEAKKKAEEEEARRKAEAEAKKKAEEEEARRKAEAEAKKKAEEEEARKKAEAEAKKKAEEEEARKKAEAEAKKKAEEEEARRKAGAEAKKKAEEEEARRKAEAEAKKKAEEEEARKKAEAEAKKKAAAKRRKSLPPTLEGLPLLEDDEEGEAKPRKRPPPRPATGDESPPKSRKKLKSVEDLLELSEEYNPSFEKD